MSKKIYLAGGCFWGTEHFFRMVHGVLHTEVGYANGHTNNPTYEEVCRDMTGYAETVEVCYDPSVLSLELLLELYYKTIKPTEKNKQGNDIGTQYRTGIYYTDSTDLPIIELVTSRVANLYNKPLAVEIAELTRFFRAEDYHQDYLCNNPSGYCHISQDLFITAKKANR